MDGIEWVIGGTLISAVTLALVARREFIEWRSQRWSFPVWHPATLGQHGEDAYVHGAIANVGTGPMHHLSVEGRSCHPLAGTDPEVMFTGVHWLDVGGHQEVTFRCDSDALENAWIVFRLAVSGSPTRPRPLLVSAADQWTADRGVDEHPTVAAPRPVAPCAAATAAQTDLAHRPRRRPGVFLTGRQVRRCYAEGQNPEKRYAPPA